METANPNPAMAIRNDTRHPHCSASDGVETLYPHLCSIGVTSSSLRVRPRLDFFRTESLSLVRRGAQSIDGALRKTWPCTAGRGNSYAILASWEMTPARSGRDHDD